MQVNAELMRALAIVEGALREAGVVEVSFVDEAEGDYTPDGLVMLTTYEHELALRGDPESIVVQDPHRTLGAALEQLLTERRESA